MKLHVFVGPTLAAARVLAIAGEARLHRPVAHGDLLRLNARPGDVVLIIDGAYHHSGSVRHKEILALLASGVTVVGCSSMGALRAAELCQFGMLGYGKVFKMYHAGEIDSDDEVAVAHGDPPDYQQFNVPLVNVRGAVVAAQRAGALTSPNAVAVVEHARGLPYTSRSWQGIEFTAKAASSDIYHSVLQVRSFLADHPEHADVKAADAVDTLTRFAVLPTEREVDTSCWAPSPVWRNRHLFEWMVTFAGDVVNDVWVGHGSVVRYSQIYDPDSPQRWRAFALRQILASHGRLLPDADMGALTKDALELAGERGLRADSLTGAQMDEWILAGVEQGLSGGELVCRILTRSYRPPRGTYDLLRAYPELANDDDNRLSVAESYVVNAEVAGWRPGQTVDHIRESVLRDHLSEIWQLSRGDTKALTAAARDRGFASLADASDAVRPFFLRHHLRAAEANAFQSDRT